MTPVSFLNHYLLLQDIYLYIYNNADFKKELVACIKQNC